MGYEDARAERDFRQNPPSSAPGQGDDWDNMAVGSSSVEQSGGGGNIADSYNSDINNTLNNPAPGSVQQPGMGNPQQMPMSTEDKLFEVAGKGFKGLWDYIKFLIVSAKNSTNADKHRYGVRVCFISAICFVMGIAGSIWEMFMLKGNKPIELLIGSTLSMMVGLTFCMLFNLEDKPKDEVEDLDMEDEEPSYDFQENDDSMSWDDVDADMDLDAEMEDSSNDDWDIDASMDSDDWGDVLDDMDYSGIGSSDFSVESAVSELSDITPGTQTRQYLYEAYMKVLPIITPRYSELIEISEASDEFYEFEDYLRSAAAQVGMKEENYPELLSVSENPFIYRLNCTRPVGMKEQLIADEIANTFCRDSNNIQIRFGTYATVETSTGRCSINLFKGYTKDALGNQKGGVSISLGDVYRHIRESVCSTDIDMPFVWGVDELGNTLFCDALDINSIIICGEPRGGKSWKGQSILAQLAMYHSPKEVQFYVLDNKDDASDYKYPSLVLPHIRYFCGNPDKINDSLEQIINMMIATNGKALSDAGVINIKDYNKANPTNKLPYVYIIIDELQALMNYFENTDQKEEAKKFRGYLSTIVSKYPYIGLRFVLFPHRIVDQIISKNTYSLVSCRACVNQLDAKLVEASVGVTESKFHYKLSQKGDMAIRLGQINGGEAKFCHAEMLTTSNSDNKKLFEYIGSVWSRLEPEIQPITINGSMGGSIGKEKKSSSKSSSGKKGFGKFFGKKSESAPDVTSGKNAYEYGGYSDGIGVDEVEEMEDFTPSNADDIDESFWDDLLKEQ